MRGFTLIEIMLVIALTLVVGFLVTAFSGRLIAQMAVHDAAGEFSSAFRKAEAYALSGRQHSAWGVHYADSNITLFKGDSYAEHDHSYDEVTTIDRQIAVTGFSEVIFSQPYGQPDQIIPQVELRWDNLALADLSINAEGVVQKQ